MKKIKKTSFWHYFYPKRYEIGREREKKKTLDPNIVHTRPRKENSEKNSKKIQKIKKPLSSIIYSQKGMRKDEKERKTNFSLEFCSQSSRVRKFRKNSKNIQKIKKLNSGMISIQKG